MAFLSNHIVQADSECQATSKTEPLPTSKTEPPLGCCGVSLSE